MLRKIALVLSFMTVLGVGLAIAMPSASFAKDNKQQQQQWKKKNNNQQQQKKFVKPQNKQVIVKKKYVIGRKYNGHIWYGYNRHRWHGVWYAYGVGPCWINIDGLWFWNVLACP